MTLTITRSLRLGALACAALVSLPVHGFAQGAAKPRTIEIKASDSMKFDVTSIQARPGETLRVRLIGAGTMPKIAMSHNFVLLKKEANAQAFAEKAMMAQSTGFIPAELKSQVIAATTL